MEKLTATIHVFGVDEMLAVASSTPLHTITAGEIADYGELCDSDCQDCD